MWSHVLIRLCVLLIKMADLPANPAITPALLTGALCLSMRPYLWAFRAKRQRYLSLNSFIWRGGKVLLQPRRSHQSQLKPECLHLLLPFCFHLCPFVGWLVCVQDYTKTTEHISMKLGWRMCLGPKYTPFTFCADPDEGKNPGIFFLTFFIIAVFRLFLFFYY